MKIMCPPGYHHSGFVATHALGHMMYGYTLLIPMAIMLLILCSLLSLLVYIYMYIWFLETYFTTYAVWMNSKCEVSLASDLRAIADVFQICFYASWLCLNIGRTSLCAKHE